MSQVNWSSLIKEYRDKKFITQKEFADKLGVSWVTINRWENGHYNPTTKLKRKIVDLFKEEKYDAKL